MSSKTRTRKTRTTATTTGTAPTLRSVPEQTVAKFRTDTEDKVWEALHANPNGTAADLSTAAKIGKSTAQKILAKWASDGSVTRTPGIAEGSRRAADLWTITEVDNAEVDNAEVDPAPVGSPPAGHDDATDTAQAESDDAPAAVAVALDAPDTDGTKVKGESTEPTDVEPTDTLPTNAATDGAQDPADAEATPPAAAEPVVTEAREPAATDAGTTTKGGADPAGRKTTRLAPGALRGMVEDHLRDNPGKEFSPVEIARVLGGKSTGAVSNALDKLAGDGTAVRTKDKPRRFALAPTEWTAAAAPTS